MLYDITIMKSVYQGKSKGVNRCTLLAYLKLCVQHISKPKNCKQDHTNTTQSVKNQPCGLWIAKNGCIRASSRAIADMKMICLIVVV